MLTQTEQSLQVSTPKIWGSATASVNVGDIINTAFMPVMRVIDKQTGDGDKTWLLIEPTNAACPKQWVEAEDDLQQPAAKPPSSRKTEIVTTSTAVQTIEAFGVSYTEYRYEPEVADDSPIVTPLTCGQCDYYQSGSQLSQGNCTLLTKVRGSSDPACPQLAITAPF